MNEIKIWDFIKKNVMLLPTIASGVILLILAALQIITVSLETSLVLGLLTALTTSEMIEKSRHLSKIESDIAISSENIIKSQSGVKIQEFSAITGGFEYLADRLLKTTNEVDHGAFAPPIPKWSAVDAARLYSASLDKMLHEGKV